MDLTILVIAVHIVMRSSSKPLFSTQFERYPLVILIVI
jgi:hypothetical protein